MPPGKVCKAITHRLNLGACPQEKFEKQVATHRLSLGAFQDWTIAVSHFNWKLISDKHVLDKLTIAISIHKCISS